MIAIGIPTLNEADNIVNLVDRIDRAASNLGVDILIINADNNSSDGTSKLFQNVKTYAPKVSLVTQHMGKGSNVKAIIDHVLTDSDITYCMFVDGDVTSFDTEWLEKHLSANKDSADYVVPNYARYMQEGNTTNHFVYPLLSYLTLDSAPYQGIAGDFGISRQFALYLSSLEWPNTALAYGVDIFMTMHALSSGMRVQEVVLKHKLHKPSFNKMVGMFQEVAESYFVARNQISAPFLSNLNREIGSHLVLLPGKPISEDKLEGRLDIALGLFRANEKNKLHIVGMPTESRLDRVAWAAVLAAHEQSRGDYTPKELATSLTPFYLLRVVTYLSMDLNPTSAAHEITQTAILLKSKLEGQS